MSSIHRLISRWLLTDNFCWKNKRCTNCREKDQRSLSAIWSNADLHQLNICMSSIEISLSITISSQIYSLCLSWNVQESNNFLGFSYVACYLYSLCSPLKRHSKLQSLHWGVIFFLSVFFWTGNKSRWRYLSRRKDCQPPGKAAWQERAGESLPSDYNKASITTDFYQQGQELNRQGQLRVISSVTYLQGLKCKGLNLLSY